MTQRHSILGCVLVAALTLAACSSSSGENDADLGCAPLESLTTQEERVPRVARSNTFAYSLHRTEDAPRWAVGEAIGIAGICFEVTEAVPLDNAPGEVARALRSEEGQEFRLSGTISEGVYRISIIEDLDGDPRTSELNVVEGDGPGQRGQLVIVQLEVAELDGLGSVLEVHAHRD